MVALTGTFLEPVRVCLAKDRTKGVDSKMVETEPISISFSDPNGRLPSPLIPSLTEVRVKVDPTQISVLL